MKSVSIIVPTYNEEKTILKVLKKINDLKKLIGSCNIVVVNDGSTDNSSSLLNSNKNLYTTLIEHDKNKGKGKAVISGLQEITSGYVLIQDADFEYDPEEIPRLLEYVEKYNAEILLTSRLSGSQITKVHYFWHKIGNIFLTFLFNLVNNTTFTDLYSGYLIFKRELIEPEKLKFYGWGQQAELMTYLVSKSSKIYECPISYTGRTYQEGKKIRANAMLNVLAAIFITRVRNLFT